MFYSDGHPRVFKLDPDELREFVAQIARAVTPADFARHQRRLVSALRLNMLTHGDAATIRRAIAHRIEELRANPPTPLSPRAATNAGHHTPSRFKE